MKLISAALAVLALASVAEAQRGGTARLVREVVISDDAVPDGFTAVGTVVVGPGKRVYVAQARDNVVRMFDSTGKFVRTVGAKGQGPGETENLGSIGFIGDTLWTHDWRAQRFAFFMFDGTYNSTLAPPGVVDTAIRGRPIRIAASQPLADGSVYYGQVSLPGPGPLMPPAALRIGTRDGRMGRVVTHTDSLIRGRFRVISGDRQTSTIDPHFGQMVDKSPLVAVGEGGAWFAIVRRDECTATQQITVLRTSIRGDTSWRTRIECPRVSVPRGFVDSIVATHRDRFVKSHQLTAAEAERQIRPAFGDVTSFTPVRAILTGSDQSIWIRPTKALGDSLETWVRANAQPNQPAQFTLPPRAQLKAIIDATHIWVMELDSDDLPTLVRYRLALN
jgi:hypothetical protein